MPQEFLHSPDIIIRLQQVGGEAMAKGVDTNLFGYASQPCGIPDRLLPDKTLSFYFNILL